MRSRGQVVAFEVVLLLVAGHVLVSTTTAGIVRFNTVALSHTDGVYGPQLGEEMVFSLLGGRGLSLFRGSDAPMTIGSTGEVHFSSGYLRSGSDGPPSGIWHSSSLGLKPLLLGRREGAIDGLPSDSEVFWIIDMAVARNGKTLAQVTLFGEAFNDPTQSTLWEIEPGRATPIILPPSVNDDILAGVEHVDRLDISRAPFQGAIGANGTLAATIEVRQKDEFDRTSTERALWVRTADGSAFQLTRDDIHPSLPSVFTFHPPVVNSQELAVFSTAGSNSSRGSFGHAIIWKFEAGEFAPAVITGSDGLLGPQRGEGIVFENDSRRDDLRVIDVNAQGQFGFTAALSGASQEYLGLELLRWTDGQLATLARASETGGLGPQLGEESRFTSFEPPMIDNTGDVLFIGRFRDGEQSGSGVWRTVNDEIHPIAVSGTDGQLGPGLGEGIFFADLQGFKKLSQNARGDVAILASLMGETVTTENDLGLWIHTEGELIPILREGDLFDVDPGIEDDLREIFHINFTEGSTGENGRNTSFNDKGTLVFELYFRDQTSGIFTVTVPEPTTAALLGLTALLMMRRQRSVAG